MDSISKCRRCGHQIFWHKSKAGKFYPTDSADNPRDFHKCAAAQPQPTKAPKALTPDYFEPSLEQRVEALEKQLAALTRTVQEVQARQPISDSDVTF